MADPKPTFKRGDVLPAETINALIEATGIDVRGGAGVQTRRTRRGVQITGIEPNNRYLGVATSSFAALSGSTPGSGTVDLYWIDTSGPTIATLGISVTAYNSSSTVMTSGNSIDSGMKCWVEQDAFGVWHVSPLECS